MSATAGFHGKKTLGGEKKNYDAGYFGADLSTQ